MWRNLSFVEVHETSQGANLVFASLQRHMEHSITALRVIALCVVIGALFHWSV